METCTTRPKRLLLIFLLNFVNEVRFDVVAFFQRKVAITDDSEQVG